MSFNPSSASVSSVEVDSPYDPSFLIIGAQKAATTWLFQMLNQHQDIFIPDIKEVNFFNKSDNYQKGLAWYREQFLDCENEKVLGDATPNYLWTSSSDRDLKESNRNPDIPSLVHNDYPDIKLIVCLRDPVERARSAFLHHIRARNIPPDESILNVGNRYGILSMGYYDRDLMEWFRYFSREQFQIFIYEEDILQNTKETIRKAYNFLNVDDDFSPNQMRKKYNKTEGDTYLHLHYYMPWVAKLMKKVFPWAMRFDFPKIEITEQEREKLKEHYASHVQRLEELLGRSLPWESSYSS